jgi:hypothetical protein
LKDRGDAIFRRCESPREVRRFLNYLRLVATGSGDGSGDPLEKLREDRSGIVDRELVDLAACGPRPGDPSEVQKYFEDQCDFFGLDPETFVPRENPVADAGDEVVL